MPLIEPGDPSAWTNLNRSPFIFRHCLQEHPLFELSRLAKLAVSAVERGDPLKFAVTSGEDLSGMPLKQRLAETILRIEEGHSWMKISSLQELHPDYSALLESIVADIENASGLPLRQKMKWPGLSVFIASPNMITPYHFDHETNFLFQIRGEKDVKLFNQDDRLVLSEEEIEDFYRGNAMAGKYRDELNNRGSVYRLTPNTAVHHPPLSPHLIHNGDNVSISLSAFFSLPEANFRASIYQTNYLLRRAGLHPSPPGQSIFKDRLKNVTIRALSKSKPRSWEEDLFSGIDNVRFPMRVARGVRQRFSGHHTTERDSL
jgi:hypothetical protein